MRGLSGPRRPGPRPVRPQPGAGDQAPARTVAARGPEQQLPAGERRMPSPSAELDLPPRARTSSARRGRPGGSRRCRSAGSRARGSRPRAARSRGSLGADLLEAVDAVRDAARSWSAARRGSSASRRAPRRACPRTLIGIPWASQYALERDLALAAQARLRGARARSRGPRGRRRSCGPTGARRPGPPAPARRAAARAVPRAAGARSRGPTIPPPTIATSARSRGRPRDGTGRGLHAASVRGGSGLREAWSSRSTKAAWAGFRRRRASPGATQATRSISGTRHDAAGPGRPLDLDQHAPDRARVEVALDAPSRGRPCRTASAPRRGRSRRHGARRGPSPPRTRGTAASSSGPRRRPRAPLGIDQAPVSRRAQIGPPGWATSTSTTVVDAAVQEQSGGQLGHRQVRTGAAHTKAPEGTVPYRHAHATAKQARPCRSGPGTIRLVDLAASSAAVRGPGPMITHRSGVGTTGPFGQTERYPRARGATTGLSTKLRPGCGEVVHVSRRTVDNLCTFVLGARQSSATTPRADRAGATSWWRRQRASYVSTAGAVEAADDDERVVDRRRPAADEPLRPGRRLAADHADRAQHRDLVGQREKLGHRAERPAGEVRVEAARDDVAAALAERLHDARRGCRRRTAPPRCPRGPRRARARATGSPPARPSAPASTGSAPCSGSRRTRRACGRPRPGGRAGSGAWRSRRGGGGAAARRSCPTTCSRR